MYMKICVTLFSKIRIPYVFSGYPVGHVLWHGIVDIVADPDHIDADPGSAFYSDPESDEKLKVKKQERSSF